MSGSFEETDMLLKMIQPELDICRYRNCYPDMKDSRRVLVIKTRTGGDNRDYYSDNIDELRSHHLYMYDEDDSFDDTYAYFTFMIPKEHTI